jgi:serine/threonine-protein kinase haspin
MYQPPNELPIVLKIIPIEGELIVNGEQQKRFDEILTEIVISMELSGLRHDKENSTDGFVNVKRVTCVKGAYPQHLLDEWETFHDSTLKGSENDNPEIFDEDQLYVVFELCHSGLDLEAFKFKNAEESYSVFLQVSIVLRLSFVIYVFSSRCGFHLAFPAVPNLLWMGENLVHLC